MTAIVFTLALIALVAYGLERNHRRQRPLTSSLAGSTTAEDRDLSRLQSDLRAAATHTATPTPSNRRPTPSPHAARPVTPTTPARCA
ncbi:hypothetical protein [Saccharothrix hoggarensis]|uniref:Uncharacterized protein n=1 Tax=Saccharothrix hoggarensis TaxID=913853 RepID=A0ABW3QYV8_9PSEU